MWSNLLYRERKVSKVELTEWPNMILNTNDMEIQYVIMAEENKNEFGYVPNYDELIAEAPNTEMVAKWEQCRELHEKIGKEDPKYATFAFNSIYMMKMKCGHYEIFQHATGSEEDLIGWIELMLSDKYYKKCTSCICDFK